MRRLREASASIFSARLSLSAVSSSTELLAVFTSMPSFFSRSITSWLERFRSLASWKTLTFTIRLPSPRPVPGDLTHRGCLRLRFGPFAAAVAGSRRLRGHLRGFGFRRRLGFGRRQRRRLLRREALRLHALRFDARGLLGVAAVPVQLRAGGRLAQRFELGARADALDRLQLLVAHL